MASESDPSRVAEAVAKAAFQLGLLVLRIRSVTVARNELTTLPQPRAAAWLTARGGPNALLSTFATLWYGKYPLGEPCPLRPLLQHCRPNFAKQCQVQPPVTNVNGAFVQRRTERWRGLYTM